jgi:TnpA family transposase
VVLHRVQLGRAESAYVIDGLMHNEVVKSDIHSTDAFGFSELVFAVGHLLGFSYAPRFKISSVRGFISLGVARGQTVPPGRSSPPAMPMTRL